MTKASHSPVPAAVADAAAAHDGRAVRWQRHRAERREELIDAALAAIRRFGPGVGMDEIAQIAGTSKTVIYRHFEDRFGLYRAVADRMDTVVMSRVTTALSQASVQPAGSTVEERFRAVLSSTIDSYLTLVESDPLVYRFVVQPPLGMPVSQVSARATDPVGGIAQRVTAQISVLLSEVLAAKGRDVAVAPVWATALVGSVRAVADGWLAQQHREERAWLVEQLTDLSWSGLRQLV